MRLVCQTGGSNKFWEGRTQGNVMVITFGKVGTAGQIRKKKFSNAASAADALLALQEEKRSKGYVVDGAKPAAKAAPKKKPGPLRTFGFNPGYWYPDHTFPFEVRFHEALDAEQRKALGPLVKKHLKLALQTPPWLWSDHWALFFTDRRRDDAHRACAEVKKGFLAIHKTVPVSELVFLGQRHINVDGSPSPGPFWPTYDFLSDSPFERERSDPATPPAADPRFEKARR